MRFFKQLFCNHEYTYLGSYTYPLTVWGIEVRFIRISKYKCNKCNKVKETYNIEL